MTYKAKITFKYDSKEQNVLLSSSLDKFESKDYISLLFKLMVTTGYTFEEVRKSIIDYLFDTDDGLKNELEKKIEMRVDQVRKNDLEWSNVNDSLGIIERLGSEIIELKAKNSRLMNPDYPGYTEEEKIAMSLRQQMLEKIDSEYDESSWVE